MVGEDVGEPRRKSSAETRARLVQAARAHFVAESYENVGLRDIARDAGVDVALVSRYFGSKEGLFREVLEGGKAKFDVDVPADALPAYLADMVRGSDADENRENAEKLLVVLRSASSPAAAQIIREIVETDVLKPLGRLLGGDQADLRAALLLAVLMGTTVLRTIMSVEPLCEGCPDAMHSHMVRLFEAALAEGPADPEGAPVN